MQSAYLFVIFHVKHQKIPFHAGAHLDGYQHGERKPTETYVTELVSLRYRGYYTVAGRYDFYVRVAGTISHE